ncbi:MAG: protein jag [Vicinamibacterales bacterium]
MTRKLNDEIVEFVQGAVKAMGLDLEASIEDTRDGPRVNLEGEEGDVLIQRKGEALLALQHVANSIFRLEEGRKILIDCLGYRREKETELRQMARFLADKARSTGLEQELGPLNPYERRIVHMAVAEDPTASSYSVGDAFMKTVIISAKPEKR